MAELEKYPQWVIDMAQDMLDMRDAQRAYFKQPSDHRLKLSKIKEQRVDNGLAHFIKDGIIAHKEKPTNIQNSLFP